MNLNTFNLSFAKTNNVCGPFQICPECKDVKHDRDCEE